ncbi:MAG TPA: polysaccharide biosynthesis/export family protein [Xanthomonadaceae bacterium]|nr:polysaccharide biosynthesis/export family protein [Xanthomonadaceae bacterium]
MTIPLRALAALTASLALAGCTGQYLTTGETPRDNFIETGEVKVVPITPELVATLPQAASTLPAELTGYRPETYHLQPGDTLIVTVWDHPELTTPAGSQQQTVANGRLVQPDGTFYFPYAGKIQAAGKSIEQVRSTLASRLGKYLKDPQVDLNVVGSGGRVALEGAFTNTTPLDITPVPLTLSQAVGRAGINAEQADLSGLMLTRDGQTYRVDLDALNRNGSRVPEIYLKPGDRLYLPFNDRKEVYVVGEVSRPTAINFKTTDITLTQALGRAGGLDPTTSKGSAVYVIRGSEGANMQQQPATVFHLNAKSPVAFALADKFPLQAGDVVFVGPAGVTRWNRFISQVLPLTSILRNAANAQQDFSNN